GVQHTVDIMKMVHGIIRSEQGVENEGPVACRLRLAFLAGLADILLLHGRAWLVEIGLAAATGKNQPGCCENHSAAADFFRDLRHSNSFIDLACDCFIAKFQPLVQSPCSISNTGASYCLA